MKILVVEDEKKVASFIKRGLEEEQYEVTTAADGEEGLKLALEKPFDLIVLDWMLPKKDGLSVLKELRERKNVTPILMLTAKDSVEDIVAGLDSGSDDYLTKPFAFAELLARVRALMRRSELDRGAEIRFADLRLDPVTHKVWRKDKEIDLTAKEYGLLEYFMRNPHQVLTRTMIAEHVWDYTFDSFTNIIDVYVNYLRKKIDRDADKKLIHTVRGVGYILKEEE
ncbi:MULTISPECIES: response regulator transcription factor [Geomonas]|jgi:Response regulators consisting of a CheY-like receiver domain and a winged-helix DNA-binding domain|uniref:Response regulator transcription factor n=1 Tax=Geomonas terrae TaxID=2562681 RepID=A0A4S1CMD3_9BACT|nr:MULTISPECIES: response regulator transcription factor [Geomonas]TGU74396.1 response regulator transcription factor [Geomonas terrae]TSK07107.1 MAG: response regulator transcription factor [Geobacter sp.]